MAETSRTRDAVALDADTKDATAKDAGRDAPAREAEDAERHLGRLIALGLPVATVVAALGMGLIFSIGLALLTLATVWMATLAPDTPRWVVAAMLAGRGFGIGLSMMPAISSAYVTLAPALIAAQDLLLATSISAFSLSIAINPSTPWRANTAENCERKVANWLIVPVR